MRIRIVLLFILLTSCSSNWEIISTDGPEVRYITQLIYADNKLVLFGGKNDVNKGFNDMWEWNGEKWNIIGNGATKRWDHSYVYMKNYDQIFLFGGRTFEQIQGEEIRIDLNDNWIYKNKTWEQLEIQSPKKRSSHGLAFNEKNDEVILFGGRNNEIIFNDTWIFNGEKWRELEISGPKKRFGHTLNYDQKSEKIYLFGGHDGESLLDDFWVFDGNQWIELENKYGPSPRMAHAMQFDNNGNAILHGGWDISNTVSNELWFWKEGKWAISEMRKKPQARLSHCIGFDLLNKEFVLFGGSTGFNGEFLKETWKLKTKPNKDVYK